MRTRSTRRCLGRNPEAVTFGSLFLALFAVTAWATLVLHVGYPPVRNLVDANPIRVFALPVFLTQGLGIALGALVYARLRNVDIPLGLRTGDRLKLAVPILFVTPLLVGVVSVVGNVVFDTSVSAMTQTQYAPTVQVSFLFFASFVPSLFRGLGYGLLFFGVVHERIRDVTTPLHALVLTPAVVWFFWEMRGEIGAEVFDPWTVAHFAVLVVVSVGFGASLGLLYRGTVRESAEHLLRPSYVPVFTVGLLGLVGVLTGLGRLPTAVVDVIRLAAFAVAAYGYERTRSVWVPILVVALFFVATDVAVYLEAVTGVVQPP